MDVNLLREIYPIESIFWKLIDDFHKITTSDKRMTVYGTYSQLPFQYHESYFYLSQIGITLNQLEKSIIVEEGQVVEIEDEVMRPMGFFVEGFFRSMRSAQDSVMLFLNKIHKPNLPGSMSAFVKKHEKFDLPEKEKFLVMDYWDKSGAMLRDHRNFCAHNGTLVLDGHVMRK